MKDLTSIEINLVLEKIRTKYNKLISEHKKPVSLKDAFEDRYIFTLKMRRNLTVFLLAEIEAVEEIYKNENTKQEERQKEANRKPEVSFVDKVLEQNKLRYSKYPKISSVYDIDEEIAYLCGGTREFLNTYLSAIVLIFNHTNNSSLKIKINTLYNDIIENIDFKGDVPILKHYIAAIQSNSIQSKIMFEYQRSIQNIGFLLNSTIDLVNNAQSYLSESPNATVLFKTISNQKTDFSKKTCLEIVSLSYSMLKQLISDFRLKDIRKV